MDQVSALIFAITPAFWIAVLSGFVLMFPILGLLKKLKSRQTISEFVPEHKAKQGTPTMGGLIVLSGTLLALLFSSTQVKGVFEYVVVIVAFAVLGFVDDFLVPRLYPGTRGLGWKQKILLEVVFAAAPLVIFEHTKPIGVCIAVFLILFYANAYNFTDGLDSLAGSVGCALFTGLAAISFLAGGGSNPIAVVSFAIIGGLIPFLFLNLPPAKVFMGDVGSLPIGAVIGLMVYQLCVRSGTHISTDAAIFLISIVMYAELIPVPLQIASVKIRGKGKKLFLKTPIHHAFQEKGIAETRIVGAYFLCQVLLTVAALGVFFALENPELSPNPSTIGVSSGRVNTTTVYSIP